MICVRCLFNHMQEDDPAALERVGAAMTVFRGEAVCLPHYGDLLLEEEAGQ